MIKRIASICLGLAVILYYAPKVYSSDDWPIGIPYEVESEDYPLGYVITNVGSNEGHDFSPPLGAEVCEDWQVHGASEDWFYLSVLTPEFDVGGEFCGEFRVFSNGVVEPLYNSKRIKFVPFKANIGILPYAHWNMLGGGRQSRFWYKYVKSKSLKLTWENVLLDRDINKPISFQMEIWPTGRICYRYDFKNLDVEIISNILVSVSKESLSWKRTTIYSDITSFYFNPIRLDEINGSDLDNDGISLEDELFYYGTDPRSADSDGDGLDDLQELLWGTDPWDNDTDGDDVEDGKEIDVGADPFVEDTDGDGLSDYIEISYYCTDPSKRDTDSDGIPDVVEVLSKTCSYMADTDGDGLNDEEEAKMGLDPLVADEDNDGAPDGWEVKHGANINECDSDGDGLSDGFEYYINSSPILIDTDGDGLSDYDEVTMYKSSPTSIDGDNDGLTDWQEIDVVRAISSGGWMEHHESNVTNLFPLTGYRYIAEGSKLIDLPFAMNICGGQIERILIDVDGKLALISNEDDTLDWKYNVDPSKEYGIKENDIFVAGYWDNLKLSRDLNSKIALSYDAAATNVVISYENMLQECECINRNCTLSFQVVLSCDTNFPIRINYRDVSLKHKMLQAKVGAVKCRKNRVHIDDVCELFWGNDECQVTDDLSIGIRFGAGTMPYDDDSDMDGLKDGEEISLRTNPLDDDTDGDWLCDGDEILEGTNPFVNDTDRDGMPDKWEVDNGLYPLYASDAFTSKDKDRLSNLLEYQLGTSPILVDTDGDGLNDDIEYERGTSPLIRDTDGDGLDDFTEYKLGISGTSRDSDNDGLEDGWEVKWNFNPKSVGNSQGRDDADMDGLSNIQEQQLGTNPRVKDTDGDGLDDGEEVGYYCYRYRLEDDWASTTNGWMSLDIEADEESKVHYLDIYRDSSMLTIRGETVYGILCQWNGILLMGSNYHYYEGPITRTPTSLDGNFLSDAALLIAPYWTQSLEESKEPTICAFKHGSNGDIKYAIQYLNLNTEGTNTVSFQATLIFTNAVYKGTEIIYERGREDGVYGYHASIGVQDRVSETKTNIGFNRFVAIYTNRIEQIIQGTGTDPLNIMRDSDGDGLSDEFELSIGIDPRQPDTDGDGMHDGWEHKNGFNPSINNDDVSVDSDPTNDSDYDADGDGLSNKDEADYGTNPLNSDSDGDGVSDGKEVKNSSDPDDESDGGIAGSRVPVLFNFGDPSGSHSEKYRLTLTPVQESNEEKPTLDEMPKSFEWINAEYGECETKTAMLLPGWIYAVRMYHAGTDPKYGSSPDYDYSLTYIPPTGVGVVADDSERLFGSNANSGETYEAEGKVAYILVLDGGIVADYDRKNGFTNDDLLCVYQNKPLRHWINDDDDYASINDENEDIPGMRDVSLGSHIRDIYRDIRIPDYHNNKVDGVSDTLDFTPVWINMGRALVQLDGMYENAELTLSNEDGAINIVWTSLEKENAGDFLTKEINGCGEKLSSKLSSAKTTQITKEGVPLPGKFVAAMRENPNKGIILLEGRAVENIRTSTAPLVLRAYQKPRTKESVPLFELKLPLSISPVEDMFRWIDERWVCGDTNNIPTRVGVPANYPDSERDSKHYIFVHGYAVSVESARGWASEMFKRLHQSGSNSRFTAVDWRGDDTRGAIGLPSYKDETPNYYINVEHAFETAPQFVQDCAKLDGEKIILAHSLGNMLVSSAAKDHGLVYKKYYMLNAAVPMEAYDNSAFAPAMIDHDWRGVTDTVYSANWWRLFNEDDGRNILTWRRRFSGISNAINCYSESEDVLGNVGERDWLSDKFDNENYWAIQEVLKGTKYAEHAPNDWQMNSEGGWGYNNYYTTNKNYLTRLNRRMTDKFRKRIRQLTRKDIIEHPVFKPFFEDWLFTTNFISGEMTNPIRTRLLADAIPATSFAAGANPLGAGVDGNINYNLYISGVWPRDENKWWHSDIKNIAFRFNNKFFKKLVMEEEK